MSLKFNLQCIFFIKLIFGPIPQNCLTNHGIAPKDFLAIV